MAVSADESWIGGLAAWAMNQLERTVRVLGCEVPVRPSHEADDGRIQLERAFGQPVLVPVRVGPVANALEQAVGDELPPR
jgi:hypothetical protein